MLFLKSLIVGFLTPVYLGIGYLLTFHLYDYFVGSLLILGGVYLSFKLVSILKESSK